MMELSLGLIETVSAPPLAPVDRMIDLDHLSRMTLGDRELEGEVLRLFDRQAAMLMTRMDAGDTAIAAAAAHTLKGSAAGIGAWPVARAAGAVETAALARDASNLALQLSGLKAAVRDARAEIADLLRAA